VGFRKSLRPTGGPITLFEHVLIGYSIEQRHGGRKNEKITCQDGIGYRSLSRRSFFQTSGLPRSLNGLNHGELVGEICGDIFAARCFFCYLVSRYYVFT
jgi:hypothetical protein